MSKSKISNFSREQIVEYVQKSKYYSEVLTLLGYKLVHSQGIIKTLQLYCDKNNIDYSHLLDDMSINTGGEKICSHCLQSKPISEFYISKGKVHCYCKECHKELGKINYQKRTKELENYKKTLSCQKCGENRFYLLDFHHRDPNEKDYEISDNPRASLSTLQKEIQKYDVLCSNCHREWHYLNKINPSLIYEDWINGEVGEQV